MKYQEKCELLDKQKLTTDIFKYRIKTDKIAKEAKPGQFLEIRVSDSVEPFLRRPISIYSIVDSNTIEFIFQVKGNGTKILSEKNIGDEIDILGPLGNGIFEIKDYKKVAIIGGGIGSYPLYEIAKELKDKAEINTYLGFRSKEYVTCENEFQKVSNKLVITTDDGSYGEKGFAIDYLKRDKKPDVIMACGPLPMLRAVKKYAMEENIPCQVSLEERMGCGIGACLGCAVKTSESTQEAPQYKHVCKDGPVFNCTEVEF